LKNLTGNGATRLVELLTPFSEIKLIENNYSQSTTSISNKISELSRCTRNPFLSFLSEEDFIKAEKFALKRRLLTGHLIREYKNRIRPAWEVFIPVVPNLCENHFVRVGNVGDGGKDICGFKQMNDTNCVIFSLGSNDEWSFEKAMLGLKQGCRTITFDCTGNWKPPREIADRAIFKSICFNVTNKNISTYENEYIPTRNMQTMMIENKVKHLSLLKMDIEGAEWSYFFDFENTPLNQSDHLPEQILLEIHWGEEFSIDLNITIESLAKLVDLWYDYGYRIVDRRINPVGFCYSCYEIIRVRC